jgi:hypothetical protein
MSPASSPDIKLGVLALNLWFVGQALSIAMPAVTEAGPGQWLSSLAALVLVIVGMARTSANWHLFPASLQNLVLIGLAILIPMTLMGIFDGFDDPLFTALEALPWYAAIFLPAFGFPRIPEPFLLCFRWHAFIGVAVTVVVIATNWEILSASMVNRSETLGIKLVQFLLYSLFFQLFRITSEPMIHRLVALVGIASMMIIAFGSATRQAILLITIVMLLSFVATARTVQAAAASGLRKLGVVVTALVFSALALYYIYSNLQGAVNLMNKRMTTEQEGTSLRENARLFEIQQLLQQFKPVDYVFGRGIRGEFVNTAAPKQESLHIGWFRTLLKGGIPLVMLFLLGYVLVALRAAARSRDGVVLAAAFVVIYFGIKNATGNIILANGHFYIVAICVGTAHAALAAPALRPPRPR